MNKPVEIEEDDDPYLLHKQTLEDVQLCGTRSRGEFSRFSPFCSAPATGSDKPSTRSQEREQNDAIK